jgi:hypothetical protein
MWHCVVLQSLLRFFAPCPLFLVRQPLLVIFIHCGPEAGALGPMFAPVSLPLLFCSRTSPWSFLSLHQYHLFTSQLKLQPWRYRKHVPPKRRKNIWHIIERHSLRTLISISWFIFYNEMSNFSSINITVTVQGTQNKKFWKAKVKLKVTLRMAIYHQSARLGVKPLDTTIRDFFQLSPCDNNTYVTSSLTRIWVCLLWICLAFRQEYVSHM